MLGPELTIYPFLIAWVTFYLGAKIRSPLWAIVASLMAVTGAVVVPYLLLWIVIALPFGFRSRTGSDMRPSRARRR